MSSFATGSSFTGVMVKVAITGHTSGIGLAIADAFRARGAEVVGLSRSTGFDMAARRDQIVAAAAPCDIFVNNRHQYNDDSQLQLLFRLADAWQGQDKTIINLGSRAGECYVIGRPDPKWVEVPVCVIVRKAGHTPSAEDILALFQGKLARYKHPRDVIFVEGPLPRTSLGKVQKFELRQRLGNG